LKSDNSALDLWRDADYLKCNTNQRVHHGQRSI
jgi:hypothetical protein